MLDILPLKVKDSFFAALVIYGTLVFPIAAKGCLENQEGIIVLQGTFAFRIRLRFILVLGGSTARQQNFKRRWQQIQQPALPVTIVLWMVKNKKMQ